MVLVLIHKVHGIVTANMDGVTLSADDVRNLEKTGWKIRVETPKVCTNISDVRNLISQVIWGHDEPGWLD